MSGCDQETPHYQKNDNQHVNGKKNQILMNFLAAKGFSAKDIQTFQNIGSPAREVDDNDRVLPAIQRPWTEEVLPDIVSGSVDAQKVFDNRPVREGVVNPCPISPADQGALASTSGALPPSLSLRGIDPPPAPAPSKGVGNDDGSRPANTFKS